MGNYMDVMLRMRPVEQELRRNYERFGHELFARPKTADELEEQMGEGSRELSVLRQKDISPVLEETTFFSEGQDVAAFQHYRYLPAVWHEHRFFEIACVLSGEFCHVLAGEEQHHSQNLKKGDILILAPHTRHTVSAYADDAVLINILIRSSTFEHVFFDTLPEDDLLRGFFHDALFQRSYRPYLLFHTEEDQKLEEMICDLRQESVRNRRFQNTCLKAVLTNFFVQLLREHEQEVILPEINSSVMNEQNIYILQYMQKNCTTITLSHLAEFFNYSERQLQRIIMTMTGCSFSENIRRLRMKKAAVMLSETTLPVSRIAEQLGYCDVSNFRNSFKGFYHMTPQEYRLQGTKQPE